MAEKVKKMAFWDKISSNARGWITVITGSLGALGFAFGLGAATKATFQDLSGVPARLNQAEIRLTTHDSALARLQRVDSVANRNRAILDTVSTDVRDIKCILKAQVSSGNPVDCIPALRTR